MEVGTWNEINGELILELVCSNQTEAAEFVLKVARLSDELNHHADITIYQWRKVRLAICTHDEGNTITDTDHDWTKKVDLIIGQ
jgi:4a-hydroxytetrahydrobiopterin dehydratase